MLLLLLWFYTCIRLEKVDPLQGGYLRRKYRKDRRPTLPLESPFIFYPRYLADLAYKHLKLGTMIVKYGLLRERLKRDPKALIYMDEALTPVEESFDAPAPAHAPAEAGVLVSIGASARR